jgi:hypothetical protein
VRRPKDFGSGAAFFGDREIDELQAAADAHREARSGRGDPPQDGGPTQADATGPGIHEGGRRAG